MITGNVLYLLVGGSRCNWWELSANRTNATNFCNVNNNGNANNNAASNTGIRVPV